MSQHWASYFTNVNGSLASIFLDLNLLDHTDIASKPILLWVWLYFQSPRPDGLSSSEEAPTLWSIEDALVANLAPGCGTVRAGSITTLGRREFYFYAERGDGFAETVSSTLKLFPSYKSDKATRRDDDWHQFKNVLYPSDDQLGSIANGEVLYSLEKNGDVHDIPREVTHLIYFPSHAQRSDFRSAISSSGFDRFEVPDQPRTDGLFPLFVARVQPVTRNVIDKTTRQLRRLAEAHGGTYDGWETQATQV